MQFDSAFLTNDGTLSSLPPAAATAAKNVSNSGPHAVMRMRFCSFAMRRSRREMLVPLARNMIAFVVIFFFVFG